MTSVPCGALVAAGLLAPGLALLLVVGPRLISPARYAQAAAGVACGLLTVRAVTHLIGEVAHG